MSIIAKNKGNYELVPAGTFPARCYSMIHIGTIQESFQGKITELNKVRIAWELPTEKKEFVPSEGEKPYSIGKEYTLSMNEKSNLRKMLESWRGKGFTVDEAASFDITVLLGKPCLLSIIHKTSKTGNEYADISSITTLPKGMECPKQIYESFEFSLVNFDEDKFNTLPDWLKDKIKLSKEFKHIANPGAIEINNDDDDGLPF
uniref:Uncharacterized protein n=1 Tax=viral metagenome TaxID=1070528 RepID=A0A6H2A314_9ZZZZ